MRGYTESELVAALWTLWQRMELPLTEPEMEALFVKHPVLEELNFCGPSGYCGLGLGRIGGHAIGDG